MTEFTEDQRIVLGPEGDAIVLNPDTVFESEIPENDTIGFHTCKLGWMKLHEISRTHKILSCSGCLRSVIVPASVKTFQDLLDHFAVGP